MGRIRTIKPEVVESETLAAVSREARLCFLLLWTRADDAGRLKAAPALLASTLYPYDEDAPALIGGWLEALAGVGAIVRYQVGGQSYVSIPAWLDHQRISHPSPSKLPPPPVATHGGGNREGSGGALEISGASREDSRGFARASATDETSPETAPESSGILRPDLDLDLDLDQDRDRDRDRDARARAREDSRGLAKVPARVADRAAVLGLQSSADWWRLHTSHALRAELCGLDDQGRAWGVCLPSAVYDECCNRLMAAGRTLPQAREEVRAWALGVRDRWSASGAVIGADAFAFWRREWAAAHPAGVGAGSVVHRDALAGFRDVEALEAAGGER